MNVNGRSVYNITNKSAMTIKERRKEVSAVCWCFFFVCMKDVNTGSSQVKELL